MIIFKKNLLVFFHRILLIAISFHDLMKEKMQYIHPFMIMNTDRSDKKELIGGIF